MDWITAMVEGVGVLIFCVWVVVPIREFAGIHKRLTQKNAADAARQQRGDQRDAG